MTTKELQSRFEYPTDYGPGTTPFDLDDVCLTVYREARYSHQQAAIRDLLRDGVERSSLEICIALGLPPATRVDSRVRDLRKVKHGAWSIACRRCVDGVWRYSLRQPQRTNNAK